MSQLNYKEFYTEINFDQLYDELGWEVLDSQGSEDRGHCLDLWKMHKNGDTTGKMYINREKAVYNCWVCGGGSVLKLVMEAKGLGARDATAYLWNLTKQDHQNPQEFYERVAAMLTIEQKSPKSWPQFNPSVIDKWKTEDHEWFRERHISREVCKHFSLGFNARAKIYRPSEGQYEGPAIVLPHFWEGRLIGWQHRWVDKDRPDWVRKYTNTTDFPREETVWGMDFAKQSPMPPIVVESAATALFLLSEGHSALATFGSQITSWQLHWLRSFQSGVILAPDNDDPGGAWQIRATDYLQKYIKVMHIPLVKGVGSDLGDLTPDQLTEHLKGIYVP